MKLCAECGNEFVSPRKVAKFCTSACANKHKGRLVAAQNTPNHIQCVKCKRHKPLGSFSFQIRGNTASGKKDYCKACGAATREKERRERTWKNDATLVLLNNSKQRAKLTGRQHTITKEHIVIPDVCPALGIPLFREDRATWKNAPSIDRIDNDKGYTPDNIVIVSRRANIIKKNATADELTKVAAFYRALEKSRK